MKYADRGPTQQDVLQCRNEDGFRINGDWKGERHMGGLELVIKELQRQDRALWRAFVAQSAIFGIRKRHSRRTEPIISRLAGTRTTSALSYRRGRTSGRGASVDWQAQTSYFRLFFFT